MMKMSSLMTDRYIWSDIVNKIRSMLLNIRRNDAAGQVLAQLIAGIVMISFIFLAVGLLLCPGTGKLFFGAGLIVGMIAAVFAVIGMYDALDAGLRLNERGAASYIRARSILRIVVAFVLLLAAVLINVYAFAGVTAGLISIKLSGLTNKLIKRIIY